MASRVRWLSAVAFAAVLFSFSPALADEPGDLAIGDGKTGLPEIGRVHVATTRPAHLTLAGGGGYGFTESVPGGSAGSHHRLTGSLAAAYQPLPFLSASLMLDGRWDKHPDDVLGSSAGANGEPRLVVRGAKNVHRSFVVGAELGLTVPGAEAPSLRFDASTLAATLLATFAPTQDLAIAFNAGFRLDGSSNVIVDRRRLRFGDRLTLAASDANAVLLGLGGMKRIGRVELLADVSWDVLVGADAPSAFDSPLRLGLGGRLHLTDAIQVELRPEVGLSGRPNQGPADPFVPIEPRVSVLGGVRFTLPFDKAKPPTPDDGHSTSGGQAPSSTTGLIRGQLTVDGKAAPIANAQIAVTNDRGQERVVESGGDGTFSIPDASAGAAKIAVKAQGYEDATSDVTVEAGATTTVSIAMKRVIKAGQLRGLVRSFTGKPLAATIRVEPGNLEAKTDSDGTFQIDLPPGSYEVIIAAPGHAGQRRPVQVEENGVTILNADLRLGP